MKKIKVLTLLFTITFGIVFTGQVSGQTNFGPLTEPFLSIIASRNVHIKSADYEVYIKGDKSINIFTDKRFRLINKDNKIYIISDQYKTVSIIRSSGSGAGLEFAPELLTFSGSGESLFDGKNLPYEEYINTEGHKIQYFVDGNKLAGFRSISPENTASDIVISVMDQRVPDRIFNVPSIGYTTTDNTQ